MKAIVIIKSEDLSKEKNILLSKYEVIKIEVNDISYNPLNKNVNKQFINELCSIESKDNIKYEAETEVIIYGKIFNYSGKEYQGTYEDSILQEKVKNFLKSKYGEKFNLNEKEKLMQKNLLALNGENITELLSWNEDVNYNKLNDYRDVILSIEVIEGEPINIHLESMYIYDYEEKITIEKGYGEYKVVLRKNSVKRENVDVE